MRLLLVMLVAEMFVPTIVGLDMLWGPTSTRLLDVSHAPVLELYQIDILLHRWIARTM